MSMGPIDIFECNDRLCQFQLEIEGLAGTPIDSPYAVTSMDRDRLEAQGTPTWSDFFKGLGALAPRARWR